MIRFALALALAAAALAGFPAGARAQQLSIDRAVRAADLWCFPLASAPDAWRYLPARAVLARDASGRGQLSFLRYVDNRATGTGEQSIADAAGGGLLHFLVQYETAEAQVRAAEQELRRSQGSPQLRLGGPVVFREGRFALVSSVLGSGGGPDRRVLAAGHAPVLEGNRIAFSFDLDPTRATLLLRSLQMQTSDVSVVFDLAFAGLTDTYDAELVIDWQRVQKSMQSKQGSSLLFVASDVEKQLEQLRTDAAIRLDSRGNDAASQALLDNVYTKLIELLYAPVEPEVVEREQPDLLDRIADAGTRLFGLGSRSAYRLKTTRSEGTTVLRFDSALEVVRHHFMSLNLANLEKDHGVDPDAFETVNLSDPTFRQRQVHLSPDGSLRDELGRSINNVVVSLRKRHAAGQETSAEVFLDAPRVAAGTAIQPFVYPWQEGDDSASWLQYAFRTAWSFEGGGAHAAEWTERDAGVISLSPPFRRAKVVILGSERELLDAGVKTVVVRLEHAFFGERRSERLVLRPSHWSGESQVELLLPLDQPGYDYAIEWFFGDGGRKMATGSDRAGVLFVDDPPDP